jgi:hypothetical protein
LGIRWRESRSGAVAGRIADDPAARDVSFDGARCGPLRDGSLGALRGAELMFDHARVIAVPAKGS